MFAGGFQQLCEFIGGNEHVQATDINKSLSYATTKNLSTWKWTELLLIIYYIVIHFVQAVSC
jgi:hypothetical protein